MTIERFIIIQLQNALGLLLVYLKLNEVIEWNWLLVTLPFWFDLFTFISIFTISYIYLKAKKVFDF